MMQSDALRAELQLLARQRSAARVDAASAPTLDDLVRDSGLDSRIAAIDAAVDEIPEPTTRGIARLLFADHPNRWKHALGQRRKDAGEEFGFNAETFRKKGADGLSHYDQVTVALCEALQRIARPEEDLADSEDPEPPELNAETTPRDEQPETTAPSPPARRRWIFALAASLVVVAGIAIALVGGGDDPSTTDTATDSEVIGATSTASAPPATEPDTPRPTPTTEATAAPTVAPTAPPSEALIAPLADCDIPLSGAINPAAVPSEVRDAITAQFETFGGLDELGCPLHTLGEHEGTWLQAFAGGQAPPGSLLVTEVGTFWAERSVVDAYVNSLGGQVHALAGSPIGYDESDGHPRLVLSSGGIVIAQQLGGPAFWVPAEALDTWIGPTGPYGLPMTDVNYIDGLPTQEYELGGLQLSADQQVVSDLPTDATIAAVLATITADPPGIISSFDETAWWIDDDGQRRWIPDGGTWLCLGGEDALLATEVPGWAIGSYPRGPAMTCGVS